MAHKASIQDAIERTTSEMNTKALSIAEGLKQQIKACQRARDQAIKTLQRRNKEYKQTSRDMRSDYNAQTALFKANREKEKVTRAQLPCVE